MSPAAELVSVVACNSGMLERSGGRSEVALDFMSIANGERVVAGTDMRVGTDLIQCK